MTPSLPQGSRLGPQAGSVCTLLYYIIPGTSSSSPARPTPCPVGPSPTDQSSSFLHRFLFPGSSWALVSPFPVLSTVLGTQTVDCSVGWGCIINFQEVERAIGCMHCVVFQQWLLVEKSGGLSLERRAREQRIPSPEG